jgi:hypothetical protein
MGTLWELYGTYGELVGTHRELIWNASTRDGKLWERGEREIQGRRGGRRSPPGGHLAGFLGSSSIVLRGGGRFLEDISAVKSIEGKFGRGKKIRG